MCEANAPGIYVYDPHHVPTRELIASGKWSVVEKVRDIPPTRNPMRLKENPHKAIMEHGIRRRYTDYKVCILQVLESGKQTPPPGSPFTLDGPDTYWVQTTIQLNEDGTLPFAELPGMYPSLYTFDTFWEIPRRTDGLALKGITLGVAQYVVGTLDLEFRKKPGTSKTYIEKEPFWLNPEAFRAARVLLKEVSSCYHQEDLGVMNWGHAFVYHPSQINFTRALQERFAPIQNSGRWVHISALVEHLYSVKQEEFNSLPFHTKGFVRMVPKPHWAAMFILASIMDTELQVACDQYGFVWVRATVCDIKRPRPAFIETIEDPETSEPTQITGDGNIDYTGDITAQPFGYVVCTIQEIHEAFDTRINRGGTAPTDTFISFTSRYPEITFQTNHVPRTPGLFIVKFDMWTAFRFGAVAYRTGIDQWMLTTGIPLESIVCVRDHVGSYLDPITLDTMVWTFYPPRADEPVIPIDVETGLCKMPTMERWHCVMTDAERENSAELHLLDWRPYVKESGDPYLSLRRTEQNPTDKALTLSEWNGMKIWQIATIPPNIEETTEPRKWLYSQSGVNYLTDKTEREADRSRTPARDAKGRGGKGKGSGKKGKKPVKVTGAPEGEELERVGRRYFPGPATLPEAWREKKPEELVMSGPIDANPGRATMAFKQGPNGIPIFKRTWLVSEAPVRATRVLENKAGDPRLWDPTDTEFWSVCHQTETGQGDSVNYSTLSPNADTRCRLCPSARVSELVPCCWCDSWIHWRCSYTTKSGRACASHFHVTNPLDKVIITRSDDETVPAEHRGLQVLPNTFYPRVTKGSLKPSDIMIGLETYWAFKHAWRGAGYYYHKGDQQPLAKGGAPYLANALSIVASWETWYLPRPQPIHPAIIQAPDAWELDAHYPVGMASPTFPTTIPISMAKREATLIGYLSPEKGNMWRLIYETSHTVIQDYWKYAHHYAIQYSHTTKEYYSWDSFNEDISRGVDVENWNPPKDFDSRFYYYSKDTNVTEGLSTETSRNTTEDEEFAKTGAYTMNEFPSLEMKLISEDSELEKGKKRGLEGAVQPFPLRRQGTARDSSVPPGSSTARARERAAAMLPPPPLGRSTGKGWGTAVTGKLPSEFNPVSSVATYGDTPIEERKKRIFHMNLYDDSWRGCQGMLASLGTSDDNIPAFESTFLHWFSCLEYAPGYVAMEALLGSLFEVERDAYFADLSPDTPEDVTALHKAIIVDSLTNVKNYISSFGVNVRDFFDQDKSRFSLHPGKGGKGGKGDQYPALKGKSSGKSTNKPKEPTPLSKKGGVIQLDKPLVQPSIPLILHKPPAKAGAATSVVKHPATTRPEVDPVTAKESAPKAEPPTIEQPKAQKEVVVSVDPHKPKTDSTGHLDLPKAKDEAVPQQPEAAAQEVTKVKTEATLHTQQPNVEGKAVEKVGQPKSGDQPQPLLSIAGIKGVLGFGPSKPERPPPVAQGDDMTQIEQDEEADFNAAIQASLQAPTSPQVQSGAQSSTPRPTSLDDRELDLNTQLDKLSAEALRLEVITNPSIKDRSRMRTIEGVTQEIVSQLEEIAQQRMRAASTPAVSQSKPVQSAKPIAAQPVSQPQPPVTSVKAASPHAQQSLTIEMLLQGTSEQQRAGTGRIGPVPLVSADAGPPQPATPTVRDSEPAQERLRERTPVRQSGSPIPSREAQPTFPAIEDGPPPRREAEEPPKERERTPRKERTREKKKKRRSPSTSRDRSLRERQRSPTPVKDRSHRSEKRSTSSGRDRQSEERRRPSRSTKEHRHDRRSLVLLQGNLLGRGDVEDDLQHQNIIVNLRKRRRTTSPPREPSRERRRRRHSPEPSEVSREERRRSPSPKVVPDSPKVSSKKLKKSEKKEKKSSKSRRRTEAIEVTDDDPGRDERSRSERRLESSRGQPLQHGTLEDTETDEHPPKDARPGPTHERSMRLRPRFDPSRELASAQRVMEKRKVAQPLRVHGRDPGTDGPPDTDTDVKQRRRNPPPPPPCLNHEATNNWSEGVGVC